MLGHPRGGWLLASALKKQINGLETGRPQNLSWEEIKVGMDIYLPEDAAAVRRAFGKTAPGATSCVNIGALMEDGKLLPMLGKTHKVVSLKPESRGIVIARPHANADELGGDGAPDPKLVWVLPFTAFHRC